jgi:hypothetical protein
MVLSSLFTAEETGPEQFYEDETDRTGLGL